MRYTFLFFLSLFSSAAFAQTAYDSVPAFPVDSTLLFSFQEEDFFPDTAYSQKIIHSLDGFQRYYQKQISPGTLGQAQKEMSLPSFYSIGFRWRPSFYQFAGKNAVQYYDVKRPYSSVFCMFGQRNELLCDITHAQNISPYWNVAANFQRIRSEGFYLRQNTNDTRFYLSTNYHGKREHYFFIGHLLTDSYNTAENGGITDDALFEDQQVLDKKVIGVNLSDAENRQRHREAYFKHWLAFGKKTEMPAVDSTGPWMKKEPAITIAHSFRASRDIFVYRDGNPNPDFYSNFFHDTTETLDSSRLRTIENSIEVQLQHQKYSGAQRKFSFLAGAKHQLIDLYNDGSKRHDLTNIIVYGKFFSLEAFGKLHFLAGASYVVSGYNQGDRDIEAQVRYAFDEKRKSFAGIFAENRTRHPEYFYRLYSSNNFQWYNDSLKQMQYSALGLRFVYPDTKTKFEFRAVQYVNFMALDIEGLPQQYDSIHGFAADLKQDFKFGKFSLDNQLSWMWTSTTSPIRLPEFVSRHSLYVTFDLAKKTSKLQIGTDVFFCSKFYADFWMPSTAQFIQQNAKAYGAYPYFDFFVSMKIKPVRFFLKFDHVNSGFMGSKYYLSAHQPFADRAFKLGVSWVFND